MFGVVFTVDGKFVGFVVHAWCRCPAVVPTAADPFDKRCSLIKLTYEMCGCGAGRAIKRNKWTYCTYTNTYDRCVWFGFGTNATGSLMSAKQRRRGKTRSGGSPASRFLIASNDTTPNMLITILNSCSAKETKPFVNANINACVLSIAIVCFGRPMKIQRVIFLCFFRNVGKIDTISFNFLIITYDCFLVAITIAPPAGRLACDRRPRPRWQIDYLACTRTHAWAPDGSPLTAPTNFSVFTKNPLDNYFATFVDRDFCDAGRCVAIPTRLLAASRRAMH